MSEFLVYFKGDVIANRMDAEAAVAALVWACQSNEECYVTLQNARGGLEACHYSVDYWVRTSWHRSDELNDLARRANALLADDGWAGARFEADIVLPQACSYRPDPSKFPWWMATLTRTPTTVRAAL